MDVEEYVDVDVEEYVDVDDVAVEVEDVVDDVTVVVLEMQKQRMCEQKYPARMQAHITQQLHGTTNYHRPYHYEHHKYQISSTTHAYTPRLFSLVIFYINLLTLPTAYILRATCN